MPEKLFGSIFFATQTEQMSVKNFLICITASLIMGAFIALIYTLKNRSSASFVLTLAILPSVVSVIIMMVNGNIGTGVAVAGAFSLVKFRSAPGNAKEIANIFLAMGTGLICGMGYIAYAVLFTLILCLAMLLLQLAGFGKKKSTSDRFMSITIPEDLNYTAVFEDIFKKYTSRHTLTSVKTSSMGSLFKLKYDLTLRDASAEKDFIDELRIRNGNLEISLSLPKSDSDEL